MDARRLLQVMEAINLGEIVAEQEKHLSDLFVMETPVYSRLVRDEVDVISGGKGAGKSALYRIITETTIDEDLHVVRASNLKMSPAYQSLFEGDDSEDRLRSIWLVYVTSLVGNYVVDTFSHKARTPHLTDEVRTVLEALGLRSAPMETQSVLKKILGATSVTAAARGGVPGFQAHVGLKFDLDGSDPAKESNVVLTAPDFLSIIAKCALVCQELEVRLWLAFDRLDECFVHDSPVERRALRALMRTVLDISEELHHSGWIRLKVFVRSDMLTRMTKDAAFTNATHLRRAQIHWSSKSMRRLVSRRLTRSRLFLESLLATVPSLDWEEAAWRVLLCADLEVENEQDQIEIIEELFRRTADGSGEFNPRNMISLLTMSCEQARLALRREIGSRGDYDASPQPLVAPGHIDGSFDEFSKVRLQDSVLNEFPAATDLVERLRDGPEIYQSLEELAERLGLDDSGDLAEAVQVLTMSGVISKSGSRFSVPALYAFALNLTPGSRA